MHLFFFILVAVVCLQWTAVSVHCVPTNGTLLRFKRQTSLFGPEFYQLNNRLPDSTGDAINARQCEALIGSAPIGCSYTLVSLDSSGSPVSCQIVCGATQLSAQSSQQFLPASFPVDSSSAIQDQSQLDAFNGNSYYLFSPPTTTTTATTKTTANATAATRTIAPLICPTTPARFSSDLCVLTGASTTINGKQVCVQLCFPECDEANAVPVACPSKESLPANCFEELDDDTGTIPLTPDCLAAFSTGDLLSKLKTPKFSSSASVCLTVTIDDLASPPTLDECTLAPI